MSAFTIALARTGEVCEVAAPTWQDACRKTGRDDACLIERIDGNGLEVTFGVEMTTSITFRTRHSTSEEMLPWALRCVAREMDLVQ